MSEFASDILTSNAVDFDRVGASTSKLIDLFEENSSKPWISFEFFPPKTSDGVKTLKNVMGELKAYSPLFVDMTWGAGGSTSDLTLDLCKMAKDEVGLVPNMHLTCTNMEQPLIDNALKYSRDNGIRNILALRGDPPAGQAAWVAAGEGFKCALDLVRYIKANDKDNFFCVSVAGYPEGHPTSMSVVTEGTDSLSVSERARCNISVDEKGEEVVLVCRDEVFEKELDYLKEKVDAGASAILTQMFFDVQVFIDFVAACRRKGILVPIVPGIMCIASYAGFKRMVSFCKTRVPAQVALQLEAIKDDEAKVKDFGIAFGVEVCQQLLAAGAPGLHFYTLNTTHVTVSILKGLQIAPSPVAASAITASE